MLDFDDEDGTVAKASEEATRATARAEKIPNFMVMMVFVLVYCSFDINIIIKVGCQSDPIPMLQQNNNNNKIQ